MHYCFLNPFAQFTNKCHDHVTAAAAAAAAAVAPWAPMAVVARCCTSQVRFGHTSQTPGNFFPGPQTLLLAYDASRLHPGVTGFCDPSCREVDAYKRTCFAKKVFAKHLLAARLQRKVSIMTLVQEKALITIVTRHTHVIYHDLCIHNKSLLKSSSTYGFVAASRVVAALLR